MESVDFGLNISRIHKNSGEENAHPQRVSETQKPNMERNILFLFKNENQKMDFCQKGKLKQYDQ
jgi:hypothetical protein